MGLFTTLSKEEIFSIASEYGFVSTDVRALSGGSKNTSYRVDTTSWGPVLMTVFESPVYLQKGERYAEFVDWIAAQGLGTPRVFRRSNHCRNPGKFISLTGNGKPVMMSEFVEGTSFDRLPNPSLRDVGEVLASIHLVTADDPVVPGPQIALSTDELDAVSGFRDQAIVQWLQGWHERVGYIADIDDPPMLTHGDLFADNIIVRQNSEKKLAVFDWEVGGRDHPLVDLGMTIIGFCQYNVRSDPRFDVSKANELLAGYVECRPLTATPELLRDAVIHAALRLVYNRYTLHVQQRPGTEFEDWYSKIPPFVESLNRGWRGVNLAARPPARPMGLDGLGLDRSLNFESADPAPA